MAAGRRRTVQPAHRSENVTVREVKRTLRKIRKDKASPDGRNAATAATDSPSGFSRATGKPKNG